MGHSFEKVLSEEFLYEMYRSCLENECMCNNVTKHIQKELLPDRDFQELHLCITKYYLKHKTPPPMGILRQMAVGSRGVNDVLDSILEIKKPASPDVILEFLEDYIRQTKMLKMHKTLGELFSKHEDILAQKALIEFAEWNANFSLQTDSFVDVKKGFGARHSNNRTKFNQAKTLRPITQFYINELDARNNGRNLRGQLSCFLASTGVGKSHAARWIGKNACLDGYNVLHIQLEGSEDEVADAYSASLAECETFRFENGTLKDADVGRIEMMLEEVSGNLIVKSYPKFNSKISTVDVKNAIISYIKTYDVKPDIVLIDSMDLLEDASGRQWSEKGERHKLVKVARDLKDLASDEQVWMVVTYQSTIEDRQLLNDEKFVLTEYNIAEAKGLSRPLTHLVTLNQSDRERSEEIMRLNIAKSRFFPKGDPFVIATKYNTEQFYDKIRSQSIQLALTAK